MLAFRDQFASGATKPHFVRAAAAAGCSRETAALCWKSPQPATAAYGPKPAIRAIVLEGATIPAQDAAPAPTGESPELPTVAAEPSAEPEPSEPSPGARPVSATAPAPNGVALAPVPAMLAAPAPAPAPPPDTTDIENKAVATARHAVEGVASISTSLLAGLAPLAAAARKQLELAAASGTADAKWVSQMLESLAASLSKSSNSLARLVEAQSTLSGRPSQRVAVSRDESPPERLSDDEIRRRAALVMATLEARVAELAGEPAEPEEVGPNAEVAPVSPPEIQEAEVVA